VLLLLLALTVALIGLPLIVQALENLESLDGMCKGNPRAARSLQFIPLDPKSNRLTVPVRAIVDCPVNPLLQSLLRFPFPFALFPLLPFPFPLVDCRALGNHGRQVIGQGQARPQTEEGSIPVCLLDKPAQRVNASRVIGGERGATGRELTGSAARWQHHGAGNVPRVTGRAARRR
jgi:hypothetical protein